MLIGDDLDESSEHRLERHLAECPECRAYHRRMAADLAVLQEPGFVDPPHQSLWPSLMTRLPLRALADEEGRFNGWVPAVAVAAACLAMITLSTQPMEPVEYAPPRPPLAVFDQPRAAPAPVRPVGTLREHERGRHGLDPALAADDFPWEAFPVPRGTHAQFPHRR